MPRLPAPSPLPCLGLLALLLAAAPVAGSERFTGLELLWVQPAARPSMLPPCARPLTMETPRDWAAGDAAAVVVTAGTAAERQAQEVAAALLAQDTAVVRLAAGAGGGIGACAATPPEAVPALLGAVATLRVQAGAGLVVAVGLGEAGTAVLDAAAEAVPDPDGSRIVAAIALDQAWNARFRAGHAPPRQEGWAARAPLLCDALAPLTGPDQAADCVAALLPARRDHASLRRPRR